MKLVIGGKYNWKTQPERLVYLGKEGLWNQFAKIEYPEGVWCEVLDEDLHMLEETNHGMKIRTPQDFVQRLIQAGWEERSVHDSVFWTSPRGDEYKTQKLYCIAAEVFADAYKHGELS